MYVLDTILLHKTEKLNEKVIPIQAQAIKCNSLVMVLFDECNLDCGFCLRKNPDSSYYFETPSKMSRETIMDQLETVRSIKEFITDSNDLSICVVGGELFQDKFDYSIYDDLFNGLAETFCDENTKINISIYTNLLCKDIDRVAQLIQRHQHHLDFTILFSFDLVGRYTKPYMIDRVMHNYKCLTRNYDIFVNIALTAYCKNIDAIVNQNNPLCEQMNFFFEDKDYCSVIFGDYIDNGSEEYKTTEEDLVKLYTWLIDNHPDCQAILRLLSNLKSEQDHSCNELWVSRDGVRRCCSNVGDRKAKFISTVNCFGCEYYQHCQSICFHAYSEHKYCWKQIIYRYLQSKGMLK